MVKRADGTFLHSQGLMQDITAEKETQERIEFLAYHDGLTGLANQAMFAQLAQLALTRANRETWRSRCSPSTSTRSSS